MFFILNLECVCGDDDVCVCVQIIGPTYFQSKPLSNKHY